MNSIEWSKGYHEDIGEKDENGFFDYVYRYFIYHFYLPDTTIIGRRYTDEIDECAFYFYGADGQLIKQIGEELMRHLPCVVDFMTVNQGVKQFIYFNGEYSPLVLKEDKDLSNYSFVEIAAGQ